MLILEGFGNIVAAPNHEKIACILADRAKLLSDLNNLKNEKLKITSDYSMSPDSNTTDRTSEKIRLLNEKINLLEDETIELKDLNYKVTNFIKEKFLKISNWNLYSVCERNST